MRASMSAASFEHSDATTTSGKVKRAPSSASSTSSCNNNNNNHPSNNNIKARKQEGQQATGTPRQRWCCSRYHLNSVWSIWYCLVTLAFLAYLVMGGVKRFLAYAALPWPRDEQPYVELNAYVGLVGASVVVAPFFLLTSFLKVGNLANDGFKLGASLTTCSKDPPPVPLLSPGLVRNLWLHGVPTAPFLHLVAAFCLLLPRTLMQATLISSGFLPREEIWKTDLDFLVPHNDRLIVQSAMNASSPITKEDLPLPATLRIQEVTTMDPTTDLLHPLSTETISKHKQTPGKSSYVVVEDKISYSSPKWETSGKQPGNYLHGSAGGGSWKSPSLGENPVASHTRLPDVEDWSPLSPELLNYTIALLVFAIRYPSVFWHTNKAFGLLFSLQLIINGIHTILIITAFTILYKLHVCGDGQELRGGESFLLNLPATVGLLLSAVMLVTVSSSALYLYGYQKFTQFVARSRQRYHITFEGEPGSVSSFIPPCVALVVLVGLGLTHGPLLWDLSLVYRGSLDAVVLAAVIGTIVHLFLWVVLWLLLTVKSKWTFKLRVTVARACVSSARSIKLVNEVELMNSEGPRGGQATAPLLVVGAGKAYAITDSVPKKTIMGVVQKTHQEKRARGQEEEIYWLRPSKPTHTQAKPMSPRAKVTFDEDNLLTSPNKKGHGRSGEQPQEPTYRRVTTLSDSEDEAGDYALLQENAANRGSPMPPPRDPRYVDRQQIMAYRRAMEERLTGQKGAIGPDYEDADHLSTRSPQAVQHLETQGPMTPRSTRSNDSGVVPEEQSQRSDSVSTSSSNTPPEHSEESGVHSGATDLIRHRSNSVDDLTQLPPDPSQLPTSPKTASLQRPPFTSSPGSPYGYSPGRTISPGPGTVVYPAAESTVVIRRQRNIAQDIKPPVDPIYGSRPLTSFTDQQHNQQQQQQEATRETVQEDLLAIAQNSFNSSQSTNSSGYHSSSANPSSGSNSSRNSPVPQYPGPSVSPGNSVFIQKTLSVYGQPSRPGVRVGPHSPQSLYGRTSGNLSGPQRLPQAPQIPLPPIPQGCLSSGPGHQSTLQDIYGRTTGQKIYGSNVEAGLGSARHAVGRSVSLRAASGAVAKYNSPGGLAHSSQGLCYKTNV